MTVSEMVRITGTNNADFMAKIADHIDELLARIQELEERVLYLESDHNAHE